MGRIAAALENPIYPYLGFFLPPTDYQQRSDLSIVLADPQVVTYILEHTDLGAKGYAIGSLGAGVCACVVEPLSIAKSSKDSSPHVCRVIEK